MDNDDYIKLSKSKAEQLSRIIGTSIVNNIKKICPNFRKCGIKGTELFSMEKLKETEERSKARRYIFRVSELDSNIKLKNFLIDKIENLGLQSAKSQINGQIGTFLNDAFRDHNIRPKISKKDSNNRYAKHRSELRENSSQLNRLYDSSSGNMNYLDSYFSYRKNGRKIDFIEKRIPTPLTKDKMNDKRFKELFMDEDLNSVTFKTNQSVISPVQRQIKTNEGSKKVSPKQDLIDHPSKEGVTISKCSKSSKRKFNNLSISVLSKIFSRLSNNQKDYYSDADILNMIKEGRIKSDRRIQNIVITPTSNNDGLQSRLTDRMNMTMRNKFNRNFTGCKNTNLYPLKQNQFPKIEQEACSIGNDLAEMTEQTNKDPLVTMTQEGTINIKISNNRCGYDNSITPYTNKIRSSLGKRERASNDISIKHHINTTSMCSRPERLCEQIRSCRNKLNKTEMDTNVDTVDHRAGSNLNVFKQGIEVKKFIIHSDVVLKNQVKLGKKILMSVKRKEKSIKRDENKTLHLLEKESTQ